MIMSRGGGLAVAKLAAVAGLRGVGGGGSLPEDWRPPD